jgi:hypothetical protein
MFRDRFATSARSSSRMRRAPHVYVFEKARCAEGERCRDCHGSPVRARGCNLALLRFGEVEPARPEHDDGHLGRHPTGVSRRTSFEPAWASATMRCQPKVSTRPPNIRKGPPPFATGEGLRAPKECACPADVGGFVPLPSASRIRRLPPNRCPSLDPHSKSESGPSTMMDLAVIENALVPVVGHRSLPCMTRLLTV